MTDLTNAPAWVREIAERESKATPGPWRNSVSRGEHEIEQHDVVHGRCGYIAGMTAVPDAIEHAVANTTFIAAARTDIPRLIEAAAGMAEALEATIEGLWDLDGVAVPANVGQALSRACRMAADALAKYRGEVGE